MILHTIGFLPFLLIFRTFLLVYFIILLVFSSFLLVFFVFLLGYSIILLVYSIFFLGFSIILLVFFVFLLGYVEIRFFIFALTSALVFTTVIVLNPFFIPSKPAGKTSSNVPVAVLPL